MVLEKNILGISSTEHCTGEAELNALNTEETT